MCRVKKNLLLVFSVIVSIFLALLICEIIIRKFDSYSIFSVSLKKKSINRNSQMLDASPAPMAKNVIASAVNEHINYKIPLADGVVKEWFFKSPEILYNHKNVSDLVLERYKSAPVVHQYESNYVWNYDFVLNEICKTKKINKKRLEYFFYNSNHRIYAYQTKSRSPHPRFRFYPNITDPQGLVVNNLGFRGHDVTLMKSPDTIRLAFVGASTTVSASDIPYSYPELVEYWLQLWAKKNHFPYNIEVINAGRSGIASADIEQVVLNEVLPLNPDYLFYYEGSNQFSLKGVVSNKDLKKYRSKSNHFTFETKPLEKYSAIARRYYQIVRADYSNKEVDEPKKPNLEIKWPEDLSRTNPDIFNDNLPLTLSKILQNLDVMRVATESQGAEFVPMTFVWLPSHGMKLKLPEQTSIYIYLNHSMWPIKYGLIRELADFQNTVFKKYAEHYHLNLIDVDAYMPRDSLLFSDAIHNTKEGVRVRAWVVFQQVVQILDKNRQKKPVILKSTRPLNNLESNIKCYSQEDILAQCLDRHDNSFKNQ